MLLAKENWTFLGRSFNEMVNTLRRTQEELLHKEKLASMGQIAAGIAHQINNPLGTILLFADTMQGETDNDRHREDLKMIVQETLRCKKIVSELLSFARQQDVLAQESDVHDILQQAIDSVSRQPSFAQIQIVQNFASDLPNIQADPFQLVQVFVNLLNNSAEAMPGGGTITIETRRMDHQKAVEIVVTDTGGGIPEENLGKVFNPFFTTKPLGKGTGLGLSIVYGIIKMHRGQISVKSQLGKGTTFAITLPIKLAKQAET
jgi:two-component system NtrC family sensor kinase